MGWIETNQRSYDRLNKSSVLGWSNSQDMESHIAAMFQSPPTKYMYIIIYIYVVEALLVAIIQNHSLSIVINVGNPIAIL